MPEGDYGDLETAAKDFVRKFGITAGDDLENLTSLLGDGATKLQGMFLTCLVIAKADFSRCHSQLFERVM